MRHIYTRRQCSGPRQLNGELASSSSPSYGRASSRVLLLPLPSVFILERHYPKPRMSTAVDLCQHQQLLWVERLEEATAHHLAITQWRRHIAKSSSGCRRQQSVCCSSRQYACRMALSVILSSIIEWERSKL